MSRHKLAPTATAALGRTLLGAALLGAYRKEEEKIQVRGLFAGVLLEEERPHLLGLVVCWDSALRLSSSTSRGGGRTAAAAAAEAATGLQQHHQQRRRRQQVPAASHKLDGA